jgi:hypothetical protein
LSLRPRREAIALRNPDQFAHSRSNSTFTDFDLGQF